MSKRKKQSGNSKKQSKAIKEILQLEDCSKNDECGVSSVDDIRVIVFYNGPNYKVKIVIPKRSITKKILKVQNSKFDLYIRFKDLDYSESGGHLYIELKGRYKLDDRLKKQMNVIKLNWALMLKDIMEVLYCNQIFLFQRIGLRQLIQGKMRWLINNTNVILEKWE